MPGECLVCNVPLITSGWRDSVHLEHQPGHFLPDCQGTPRDIEEKEKGRCANWCYLPASNFALHANA